MIQPHQRLTSGRGNTARQMPKTGIRTSLTCQGPVSHFQTFIRPGAKLKTLAHTHTDLLLGVPVIFGHREPPLLGPALHAPCRDEIKKITIERVKGLPARHFSIRSPCAKVPV